MYLSNPVIQMAGSEGLPETALAETDSTFLGREGLGEISLTPPFAPPSVPSPPSVPRPPAIQRAGIDW